jgi:hypothetical protein
MAAQEISTKKSTLATHRHIFTMSNSFRQYNYKYRQTKSRRFLTKPLVRVNILIVESQQYVWSIEKGAVSRFRVAPRTGVRGWPNQKFVRR